MTQADINPDRLYSLAEATALVPSPYAGKVTSLKTLHRWRKTGKLLCVPRETLHRTLWFVWGSELLRLLHVAERPEWTGRTPAQQRAALKGAARLLEKHGISVGGKDAR